MYVFRFHALSKKDHEIWVDLQNNCRYIESLFWKPDHGHVPGSKAAVLKLISGDSVQKTLANQTKSTAPSFSTNWTAATIPSVMMGFNTGNIIG